MASCKLCGNFFFSDSVCKCKPFAVEVVEFDEEFDVGEDTFTVHAHSEESAAELAAQRWDEESDRKVWDDCAVRVRVNGERIFKVTGWMKPVYYAEQT